MDDGNGVRLASIDNVYELAEDIGREFEKIIDHHGTDLVSCLITKVILALENLEASTIQNEQTELEILDLKARVAQLEYEKSGRTHISLKLEQELEQIEDHWKQETKQLNDLVSKLQEENQRLSNLLAEKEASEQMHESITELDSGVLQQLTETVSRQSSELHTKDKQILKNSCDIDTLQEKMDKLTEVNKLIHKCLKHTRAQVHLLEKEKLNLQIQFQDQEMQTQSLKQQLNDAVKKNKDLSEYTSPTQVLDMSTKSTDLPDSHNDSLKVDMQKLVLERNCLRAKVKALEDELSLYKPQNDLGSELEAALEELPVQGPIYKEPDEKLYPDRKQSGIRKIFRFLTAVAPSDGSSFWIRQNSSFR